MLYNYIRKTLNLLSIFGFLLISGGKSGANEYVLGGKNNWNDVEVRNGVTEGTGRYGYNCIELHTNQFEKDEFTDLLFDFEDSEIKDKMNNYSVSKNDIFLKSTNYLGKQCGMSRNLGKGIQIRGNENSIFGKSGPTGSFCIEYWVNPSIVENGEILLNWRSSITIQDEVIYQMIRVNVYKNKINCLFSNIFYGYTENNGDVELKGASDLIPGKWSHHIISFNEENGMLEYRINGILEAIQCVSDDKTEYGTVYLPVLGVPADLEFCPKFTGYVDEFRISKVPYDFYSSQLGESAGYLHRTFYKVDGGYFRTRPLMFNAGTIYNSVKAEVDIPSQTDINFFIRSGDNYFGWDENYPVWKPVKNGEKLTDVNGRYVQIAAELLPDGSGLTTPKITEIVLNYTELPKPLPPFRVNAKKGDGCVELEWSNSLEETAGGYFIYYGTKPGEYLGRIANEGASPVDAGNITKFKISGLKNGTIYYFAIATYSKIDSRIVGEFSKEVYARPSKK